MTQAEDNVTLIWEYFDHWSKGDMETGESYWSDDFIGFQAGHSSFAGEYHGGQDLHDRWVAPLIAMTDGRWIVEAQPDIILSGDDGLVVMAHESMEREGKGKIFTDKLVVYTIANGKITRCKMYDTDQGAIDDFWA